MIAQREKGRRPGEEQGQGEALSPETTCWPSARRIGSPAGAGTART